jgi:hypothetical protein
MAPLIQLRRVQFLRALPLVAVAGLLREHARRSTKGGGQTVP